MTHLADALREFDQRRRDVALALFLSTIVVLVLILGERQGALVPNVLAGVTMTMALLARRDWPLATAGLVVACGAVLSLWLTPPPELPPAVFALIVASYSAGAHATGGRALAGLGLVAGAILALSLIENPGDVLFPLFIFGVTPWVIGRSIRGHTELARELAEKEALLAHLREQEAASAVALERSRVARELHDVLAHNLSLMVIQASGARRALAGDPQATIDAAALIERTGREALIELRQVFGIMRRGEGEALEGSPGLTRVEALVERARAAGLPVALRVEGEPVELATGADIAAYRLIQEALTNALKHAGGAATEVTVRHRPDGVRIEVVDSGGGAVATPLDRGGQGLVGMRERIGLYGGELEAGLREGGGFAVRARLPVERRVAVAV